MKKIVLYLSIIIMCFSFNTFVKAYSFTINGNSTVTVGKNISITVTASGLTGRTVISSSNSSVLSGGCDDWIENDKYTCVFTASSAGTATIQATILNPSDDDGNDLSDITRSINITVSKKSTPTQIDVNKTYSKNNNLKSLSVEGYDLDFDKDTLEYTIELEPGTEKVTINAIKEDSSANIKGIGEVNVSEGINTFEIVVTAENGNEKVYVIKMSVEEKDPINIKIDNENYRVVKRRELIEKLENYEEIDVNIDNIQVPGLYNDVTKVTLVCLKDEEGNIKYFSYNSSTGEYKEYNEFKFDLMNLYILTAKKSKYKNIELIINDKKVTAYKLDGVDDYYLLYGVNTTTGYKGYYLYDKKENSIQRYDSKLLDKISLEKDKYFNIVLVLSCVCFLSMMFLLIEINKENKREN